MRDNVINVQVYSSCNCRCSFCSYKDDCSTRIDPEFVIQYVNEHPEIRRVVLTGGEPTLAIEECSKIIQALKSEKTVIMQTNGWWGNNEKIKQIIKENPPTYFQISIDYEKQKAIDIDTIKKAIDFLNENYIRAVLINHTASQQEHDYYETLFPEVQRGKICTIEDGECDCGPALLAINKVGKLNIYGWQES